MPRLDKERQGRLEPKRLDKAIKEIESLGLIITNISGTSFQFEFKNETVTYFPYSGWASGKSINEGRGLKKLLNQLK